MFRKSTASARALRLLICGIVTLIALSAFGWSLVLAYSDSEFRHGHTEKALHFAPGDAGYLAARALAAANPTEAGTALEQAVLRDPYYSWAWIQLGLRAETAGHFDDAERDLLRAADTDRGYAPRWALSNYYYRRQDREHFWKWALEAMAIDSAPAEPLLRLAWRIDPDSMDILDRAIPKNKIARTKYLGFLLAREPAFSDRAALLALLPAAAKEDVPRLFSYDDFLLKQGRTAAAADFWNEMCRLGLLPFHLIAPDSGANLLTNADFGSAPSGEAFDWQESSGPGFEVKDAGGSQEISIQLNGAQPESFRALSQKVPVNTGRSFVLTWQAHVSPESFRSGFRWRVWGAEDGQTIAQSLDLAAEGREDGELSFFSKGESLITVALEYTRPRGAAIRQELLTVGQISLRAADGKVHR